jgi:hypothetical protein
VEGRLIEQQADEKSLSTRLVGHGEAIEPGQLTQVKQSFDPYPVRNSSSFLQPRRS